MSHSSLAIYTCVGSQVLVEQIDELLKDERYQATHQLDLDLFLASVEAQNPQIDCLILEQTADLPEVLVRLHRQAILLPAIILMPISNAQVTTQQTIDASSCSYHTAEVWLQQSQLSQVPGQIERAISQFLDLSASCRLPSLPADINEDWQTSLGSQQRRLTNKLQERLGYLGVYYKRNSESFIRNMPEAEKKAFTAELRTEYQDIILEYFQQESRVNQKIDAFVTKIFLADVSVSYLLELHMDLMDAFAKKLKLEGRSEDILLDYRLTLIDTVAHLGEMYRRSVPRDS